MLLVDEVIEKEDTRHIFSIFYASMIKISPLTSSCQLEIVQVFKLFFTHFPRTCEVKACPTCTDVQQVPLTIKNSLHISNTSLSH